MRQLTFLVLLCIALLHSDAMAKSIRTTQGGGPDGFDFTQRVEDEGDVFITCSGEGDSDCPTEVYIPAEQYLVDYAVAQIQSGNLAGSFTDTSSGLDVSWLSDNTIMSNSSITVE